MQTFCRRNVKHLFKKIFIQVLVTWIVYLTYHHTAQQEYYTQQCQVQTQLDDNSIKLHFWNPASLKCYSWPELVFLNSSGFLHFNQSAVPWSQKYMHALRCKYSVIYLFGMNEARFYEFQISSFPLHIDRDFIHVSCTVNGTTVYANFLYNVNPKTNRRRLIPESENQLNIFIFGFDSVSRYLAERKLRRTLHVLENQLNAYKFEGYARVGDNTFPNLLAAMAGKTITEAILSRTINSLYSEVIKRGYIDCHAEDWTSYYPPFVLSYPNYTHYLRTLFLSRENSNLKIVKTSKEHANLRKVVDPKCFGNQKQHKIILDYTRMCIERYKGLRKFVFFWQNEISHHQPNFLSLADQDTADLISWMNDNGHLTNSVLILMSDHGPRYGPIARHELGVLTRNLPLLSIYIPRAVIQKYPHIHENFLTNRMRLSTPFDLHETLKDVLFQTLNKKSTLPSFSSPRGISLFQEIPKYRSCYDASVPENYCPCYNSEPLDIHNSMVRSAASFAVLHINIQLMKSNFSCNNLQLMSVHSAKLQKVPQKPNSAKVMQTFVIFETIPGHAIFQATIRRHSQSIHSMEIIGDIERVNSYGNQSSCVPNEAINAQYRLYCFCV